MTKSSILSMASGSFGANVLKRYRYGFLAPEAFLALHRLKTDLSNDPAATAGGALVYTGNSASGHQPTLAGGVLSCPSTRAYSTFNQYQIPGALTGYEMTFAVIFKITDATIDQYIFEPFTGGVRIMLSVNKIYLGFVNDAGWQAPLVGTFYPGIWNVLIATVRADGVQVVVNRVTSPFYAFAAHGGVPTTPAGELYFGDTRTNLSLFGDFGFVGIQDGGVDDETLHGYAVALKEFAAVKAITLGS